MPYLRLPNLRSSLPDKGKGQGKFQQLPPHPRRPHQRRCGTKTLAMEATSARSSTDRLVRLEWCAAIVLQYCTGSEITIPFSCRRCAISCLSRPACTRHQAQSEKLRGSSICTRPIAHGIENQLLELRSVRVIDRHRGKRPQETFSFAVAPASAYHGPDTVRHVAG